MQKIFITATNTDIGKSYTTRKLLRYYASMGFRVGALKPIETGASPKPQDALGHLELLRELKQPSARLQIESIAPIRLKQPAAPFVASGGKEIETAPIFEAIERFEPLCDILLIEGAGGLMVPINRAYMMADLIDAIAPHSVLLVTHCALGCINDTLLSYNLLLSRGHSSVVAFNCKEEGSFATTSKPYFDAVGFEVLRVDRDIDRIAKRLQTEYKRRGYGQD